MPQKVPTLSAAKILKLVHGGQGLGKLGDGKTALVWGALPGEQVEFRVTKKRRDFLEGVANDIIVHSEERVAPKDEHYLSTSPWQILSTDKEDGYKLSILKETMNRAGVDCSEDSFELITTNDFWFYRNKMEYSFFGDEDGLHLALYNRGTHQKQIVSGSSIAMPEIDIVANKILAVLNKSEIRASDLKTLVVRASQEKQVVAALYVKRQDFPNISELGEICKGLVVVYSNPKSPASVRTEDIYVLGDLSLQDKIVDQKISYDVFSFFQVNIPVFSKVVKSIQKNVGTSRAVDMYSGVGAIGLSLKGADNLIEIDSSNIEWAEKNASKRPDVKVVHASSESALEYIKNNITVIVDPPRAGLHQSLVEKINEIIPPKIIYLSCNPATQARDMFNLQENYKIEKIESYNFFPRTPHIESLAVLVRR